MRYLSAHYVFPASSPPIKNGIVCVGDDGCVVEVIDVGGKLEEREKLEFYNGILVPGFINAHCHLELSHLRNVIDRHCGLLDFISAVGKHRCNENRENAAKTADNEMIANGIAAVGDISNDSTAINVKKNSKLLYHTFVELFGLDGSKAEKIFDDGVKLKNKFFETGLIATLTPHAFYSVSPELLDKLNNSRQNLVSIHNRESAEEMNIVVNGRGTSNESAQKMNRFLQKASQCLLVHNTFSKQGDVDGDLRYYYVLCPNSNLYIHNCLPDFSLFLQLQNVCIGTDSLASNSSLCILNEMKTIHKNSPQISLKTLVNWATINGAMALGFEKHLGSFEIGKSPGVNLITGIDFEGMKLTEQSSVHPIIQACSVKSRTNIQTLTG